MMDDATPARLRKISERIEATHTPGSMDDPEKQREIFSGLLADKIYLRALADDLDFIYKQAKQVRGEKKEHAARIDTH